MMAAVAANPYPGLPPFEERDSERFFGRDREIEDVLDRLAARRLLAVLGVSGCGKSSLVRAGVIPVLRLGMADDLPAHFRIHIITPGNGPIQALANALGAPSDWPRDSFSLVDAARSALAPGESLLLVVDQFEELFRFRAESLRLDGANEASLFVNLLLNAVDQREVPIYVLLTMRTDYLGECAQFRGLPEALNDCYYLTPRLTRLQQQEAIEQPAHDLGVEVHAPLVQRLLNDSAEDPDHLPVLQHLLKRLWENWSARAADDAISLADYEAVGGWRNALNQDAETVLGRFPEEAPNLRALFQWITDRGAGDKPVRRPRPFAECVEISGLAPARLQEILDAFRERALLKRGALVDLPHESVMWQWTRLRDWIAEEAERAAQIRYLLRSARQQAPLAGLALESGLALRAAWRDRQLTILRYVAAAERDEIEAWIDRSAALERTKLDAAHARELSAWAAVSLSEDPERSLILGLYAWGKQRTMVSGLEQTLHDALLASATRVTLRCDQSYLTSVAWSPTEGLLATAGLANSIKLWKFPPGDELGALEGHTDSIRSVAWSPDGSKLAAASDDRTVRIFGPKGVIRVLSGHQDRVACVAWSPDGNRLASASYDQTARLWDAESGRQLITLSGHQKTVSGVAWSPDGARLATSSWDGTAKIWDAGTGTEVISVTRSQSPANSVAWSLDGMKIAVGTDDSAATIWSASDGAELAVLHGHQVLVNSVAWSPDRKRLATGSSDETARIWDADTGRELATLRGHRNSVDSVAWSEDGRWLATGSKDLTVRIWDAGVGSELALLEGHKNFVMGVAWSPDGKQVATSSIEWKVRIWDAESGAGIQLLRGHEDSVRSVRWSPDGDRLATCGDDATLRTWESGTGKQLLQMSGHVGKVRSLAWSPDGRKLVSGGDDATARIWDSATGRELVKLAEHKDWIRKVAWSPDGHWIAAVSDDGTAVVWDAASAQVAFRLQCGLGYALGVAFSPDSARLAVSGSERMWKIWDIASQRELVASRGHKGFVSAIAWSPDGRKLATASDDFTARVWDPATGRELLTLRGQRHFVYSVAWSPDGSRLAAVSRDETAQIYAIDETLLLRLARSRITRELTLDECRRYLGTEELPPIPELRAAASA